jgi:hypothetical protein
MIIDNFDIVLNDNKIFWNFQKYEDKEKIYYCYYITIIKRRKDPGNEDFNTIDPNQVLQTFFIYNQKELKEKRDYIIKFCEAFNARAYMSLNPINVTTFLKNLNSIYLDALNTVYKYPDIFHFYNSTKYLINAACIAEKHYYNLIDCDTLIKEEQEQVRSIINLEKDEDLILLIMPTLHGIHFITKLFDKISYNENIKKTDISAHYIETPKVLLYYKSLE